MNARKLAVPALFGAGIVVVALARGFAAPPAAANRAPASMQMRQASAGLLRRLAAAADGYRTGAPVWIVAKYAFPYDVLGVFPDSTAATRALGDSGYAVFGPFVTPQDFGSPAMLTPVPHCDPTIYDPRKCTGVISWARPDSAWAVADIDSLEITFFHRSGRRWRLATRGLPLDAVFFKLGGIDKFAVPYYTELYGPAYTAEWRESLGAYIRRGAAR